MNRAKNRTPRHSYLPRPGLASALTLALAPLGAGCDLDMEPTVAGQAVIDASAERCSIAQESADAIGYAINNGAHDGSRYRQLRITMNAVETGLCTIAQIRAEAEETTMRMNAAGFQTRFGINLPYSGVDVSGIVTTHECPPDGTTLSNAFVECLDDDPTNTRFVVAAPHGGMIEQYTDRQAERVRNALRGAGEDASLWVCKGWHANGAKAHWHITSTEIGTRSFPGLDAIADRGFTYAVSFHGNSLGGNVVVLGGNAPLPLKQAMQASIQAATNNAVTVSIAGPNDANAGMDADNFVNWLTAGGVGGIQIEQSGAARSGHWQEIADGVVAAINGFP